jgi:C-terminal processing protease CtpA/Prc
VVGIIGRGHLENRWGVPHQLAALGIPDASVLLPWQREHCNEITPDLADNVFLLDEDEPLDEGDRDLAWQGPRLGVMVMPHRDGVRIVQVGQDSVAEAAGLAADDIIVSIGETVVRTPQDLTAIIRKQAPGTTLPLSVRRGSETLQTVARFPSPPPSAQ